MLPCRKNVLPSHRASKGVTKETAGVSYASVTTADCYPTVLVVWIAPTLGGWLPSLSVDDENLKMPGVTCT